MKICFLGYSARWPEKKVHAMEEVFGSGIFQVGGSWKSYFAGFPYMWLAMRRIGPDVIVAQTVYHGLIALFLRPRAPLIVENHGDLPYRNKKVARFVLKRAKAARAVSRFTAYQFFGCGLKYTPTIHIFPAWTDIDLFLDAYIKHKKPHEKIIVYAGELSFHKGVHILLDAFQQVVRQQPNAKLHLIGNHKDDEYMEVLKRKAFVTGQVSFSPHMPQEQLAKHMAQADVVAVPSIREGFGRVALEAMACGTPVVASDVGGLREVVVRGETGLLFPVGNRKALAVWLDYLLQDPWREAKIMGLQGHHRAKKLFSTEKYVDGYRELIEGAMNR